MKHPELSSKNKLLNAEPRLVRRVFRYFLPYKGRIVLAFLASGIVSACTAGSAWLIKPALDDIFIRKDVDALVFVPLAFILLTLLKGLGRYVQNLCMNYSAMHVLETLRRELFGKIVSLPLRFYEEAQVGVLMSRVINDVSLIRESLPAFVQMLRQILTMLGLLVVVFSQDFELACWAMVALPIAGAPFVWFSRALRRYGRKGAEIVADVSGMLQELLSGIRVIKAFATEQQEVGRFDHENGKLVNISIRRANVAELASPVMELIAALGIGLIIWYGGFRVIEGDMTPGTFFTFVAALVMLYDPVKSLNSSNITVQGALAGAERVFAILDDPLLQEEKGGDTPMDARFDSLEFRSVSLRYTEDGNPALNNVNLTVRAGQRVALVGPSGAGKTSLVNMIPRFYEPAEGEILLNGRPVTDYRLSELRRAVAVVSQEAFLFDMSLAGNIAYGRYGSVATEQHLLDMDAVTRASEAAFAHQFISALPKGYETRVGERGVKLSGGQKQRVTIARALLKDAPLLILDEATSALDSESERMVQQALENLMRGRTSLIIAHRLSTILEADVIIVMEHGQIVDAGCHQDLLGRCELYTRLYNMQFRTGCDPATDSDENAAENAAKSATKNITGSTA